MKINFKNIIYAVAGGILGIMIFIPFSKNIEGASITSNILTTAGGTLNIEQFQLSRKNPVDRENLTDYPNSVLQSNNENAIFRMVGSSLFNNFLSFGQTRFDRLFIGYPDKTEKEAKLAVNGAITIKSLAHDGSTEVHACVNDFGVIEACDETYYWDIGTWSDCSEDGVGTCSGTWTTTGTGSCTDTYNTARCDGSWSESIKIDRNDNPFNWTLNNTYDTQGNPTSFGEYPRYRVVNSSQNFYAWQGKAHSYNSWTYLLHSDHTNYSGYKDIDHECNAMNPADRTSCLRNNNINGGACSWNITTYQCSSLGVSSKLSCESYPHETCIWDNGSDTTHYCSAKDNTSKTFCEAYNSNCSWTEGTQPTKTRTVVCKDSNNQTVADSLCSQPKPDTEGAC